MKFFTVILTLFLWRSVAPISVSKELKVDEVTNCELSLSKRESFELMSPGHVLEERDWKKMAIGGAMNIVVDTKDVAKKVAGFVCTGSALAILGEALGGTGWCLGSIGVYLLMSFIEGAYNSGADDQTKRDLRYWNEYGQEYWHSSNNEGIVYTNVTQTVRNATVSLLGDNTGNNTLFHLECVLHVQNVTADGYSFSSEEYHGDINRPNSDLYVAWYTVGNESGVVVPQGSNHIDDLATYFSDDYDASMLTKRSAWWKASWASYRGRKVKKSEEVAEGHNAEAMLYYGRYKKDIADYFSKHRFTRHCISVYDSTYGNDIVKGEFRVDSKGPVSSKCHV